MRSLMTSTIVSLLLVACDAAEDEGSLRRSNVSTSGKGAGESADGVAADPTQPGSCAVGISHVGFASTDFVADRKPGAIGSDRRRVKPYSALRTEFQRALGSIPSAMQASASAYGDAPARWYSEPTAGAVSLYTTYSLAFTGCFDTMTGAEYAEQPTRETAGAECAKMERKFWQRTGTPDETAACVDFTLGLSSESVARRRWAHACASIMTAAGFTTY